jgi:hypothetical protein
VLASILKIKPLCTYRVNFFTIQFEGRQMSEFEDFHERLSKKAENEEELNKIFAIIDEVSKRGANKIYFNREEDNAYALPPLHDYIISTDDFGIRLFCVILNPRIVFLLNGDRKKTQKALQPGSGVAKYFRQANSLFNQIMKDKQDNLIGWNGDGTYLDYEDDYLIDVKG